MMPLNRDDDARRLFTRKRVPLWVRAVIWVAIMLWLYVVGQLVVYVWRAF